MDYKINTKILTLNIKVKIIKYFQVDVKDIPNQEMKKTINT